MVSTLSLIFCSESLQIELNATHIAAPRNAMINTASGASWVSIHHGGGVGIGRSIHAGQVSLADGTELASQKLARVLTNDPGMGVIRHTDAGYERAEQVAAERGVRIPMQEGN